MEKFCVRFLQLGMFLYSFVVCQNFILPNDNSNLTIKFGQTLARLSEIFTKTNAGVLQYKDGNLVLVTNLSSKINGVSPTQILCSFDRQNKLMVIGYFFLTLKKQEQALVELAPFPVPFQDGYGASYNNQYIVNASPQSGSYLISIIDRNLFQHHDRKSVKELLEDIDKNYSRRSRPVENTVNLILPGDTLEQIKWKVAKYGAEYDILPNGDVRIYSFGKTILSGWVYEGYIVFSKHKKAMKVFYQFRDQTEGVLFATKIPVIKKDAVQLKLLQSEMKFSALLHNDTFILASPQDGQYRVVFIDVPAVEDYDPKSHQEILKTLDRTKEYLNSR